MLMRLAAMAACVAWSCAAPAAQPGAALTLDDAFERVASHHPDLRLFEARQDQLSAEQELAALRPPLVAGAQLENALGTGPLREFDAAELTLTLASVLERGGKLDARRTLAQARFDALAVERETRRLDLLAEVARRYLAASAALHLQDIAALDVQQRGRAETVARERWRAGASPESVLLTAQAARTRAELSLARAEQQWLQSRQQLAALWGEQSPAFEISRGDPLALPALEDAAALAALLERTPELERFADQRRIAEARLQLARSGERVDLEWQFGVRGLQEGNDVALVAGIQVPLGARRRAAPQVEAARAELAALQVEREGTQLALYTTLLEAHGRYQLARQEVAALREQVLPALMRAEAASENAWRAGATSSLEWTQLQSELTATRRQQLETALDAQLALIEIQRLTGQAFIAGPTATGNLP